MTSVGEIWQLALPPGSALVAGESGLWREVSSTARLRPRPPGFESLAGAELAFASLESMHLLDESLTLAAVLSHLAEMKVAAAATLGEIDARALATANRLALPLFQIPAGANLREAEQAALHVIIEHQAEVNRRAQDAYRQLTELAIGGRGLPAIVERLMQITGKVAVLQDAAGPPRLYAAPAQTALSQAAITELLGQSEADLSPLLRGSAPSASDPPVARLDLAGGLARLVAPIIARNGVAGFISLVAPPAEMVELDRLAVGRGAAACAIELARQQAALDAQDQLQIGVLGELLAGGLADEEAVRERALRLGYDLTQPHAALVLRLPESRETTDVAELARATERELGRRRLRAPLRTHGGGVSVLHPLDAEQGEAGLKRLAEAFRQSVAERLGRPDLCVGLGRYHPGLEGLRLAHQEAEQALSLGLLVLGTARTIYFGDLGLYRLLFNIKEKDELRRFHDEMLGDLAAYDERNGADMVSTLAAYFDSNYSPTEAAGQMHLHRNTFIYRLHRIREITGQDLDDPETRLALHLALRIGETLRALGPRPANAAPNGFGRTPTARRRAHTPVR